jgi:hypothetical protein
LYQPQKPSRSIPYDLHGKQLKSTEAAKYLGLTISKDLYYNITAKANNSLRFIKRHDKTSKKKVKETAYKTYVRPQLECCSMVWHPWQKYLGYKIEQVQ